MSTLTTYSKTHPFPALLQKRMRLTAEGSSRSTWHLELDITGSGLSYKPGDAVGIFAENDPALVEQTLRALGLNWNDPVLERKSGQELAAGHLLTHRLSIHKASRRLLQIILEALPDNKQRDELTELLSPDQAMACDAFLEGRAVWDAIERFGARPNAQVVLDCLPVLTPRFYSIASSPLAYPDQIHLTVADVSFLAHGVERFGVCSRFLSHGAEVGGPSRVPIFLFPTSRFVLPEPEVPILMIGPGTGLAPFRAFIQQRLAQNTPGPMWLFFGERNRATDFYYEQELLACESAGLLRLSLAFSRDQSEKIYVQHRLLEHAAEVWAWIQNGAILYVCGDAKVMAKDVQKAFMEIAQRQGGLDPVQASEWLREMKSQQRYREDVY
jgi:sulfite reductase (NADPH) flavoprotein alpha-component